MKHVKFFAIAAIAVIALASCQKENIGYDSNTGFSQEPSEVKALKFAAPQEPKIDTVLFSVVPAHKDDDGIFVDGKGHQKATKCLFVKYNNGCKIVIYDGVLPTIEDVDQAPFIDGDMTGYNSAYYDGYSWVPAFAEDFENGIQYGVFSSTKSGRDYPRTIVNKTLENWGWENVYDGRFSTRLDGYTVTVKDGVVTVKSGESTLTIS